MKLNLLNVDNELVLKTINGNSSNNIDLSYWVNDFKEALSRATSRSEKIALLTTIPVKWSTRKIAREFGASRRMVSNAKKIA